MGSGKRQAEGCGQRDSSTRAPEPGYNLKAEGVSLSGWSLAPWAHQAKAAGHARGQAPPAFAAGPAGHT